MENKLTELPELFFAIKQIIRGKLPKRNDPNEWQRCEILRYIASKDPVPNIHDVAEFMRITAPSATSLVSLLQRKGLIRKVKVKQDKRNIRIEITPKGRAMLENYIDRSKQTMREVFSKLDEAEIRALVLMLRKLLDTHKAH